MVGVLPRIHAPHRVTCMMSDGMGPVSTVFLHDFLAFFVVKILTSIKNDKNITNPK